MELTVLEKHDLAKVDKAYLEQWKCDLLPRLVAANDSPNIAVRMDALSEACFLFSAEMAYDAAVKARALVTAMRGAHGVNVEEIQLCQSGRNLTPPN